MAVAKVTLNGVTLMDVTDASASASEILNTYTAYIHDGTKATGTATSGGTGAISVVDTTDSHGGTIREITALDISDTTAVASDVASGKYFYTANGTKTAGTATGGGSSSGQSVSGTVTGTGTTTIQIPCSFAPDVIYIYGDMSSDVSNRGVISISIIKDEVIYASLDSSTTSAEEYLLVYHNITGYNESDTSTVHAVYANGVLTIDTVQNTAYTIFKSGQIYTYELSAYSGGSSTPSATAHTIYFEFSDSTNTTITAYWDDTFISDAITATTPTTYGGKTVDSASLDGVAWYARPTETWETLIEGNIDWNREDSGNYPYCWISSLGNTPITVGSVYRVTYNNVEYRCTAKDALLNGVTNTVFGNPAWSGGADDGSGVPFVFIDYTRYGAWTGGLNVPNVDSTYYFKIERQVSA